MNKRILKLVNEAGFHQPEMERLGIEDKFQKFAELIVEEMYCFMCDATDNDKPWPSFNDVKKHFGVEQ